MVSFRLHIQRVLFKSLSVKIGIFLPNATFDLPGTPEVGGIETFAFTIGEEFIRQGHDVTLYGGKPKAGRRHRETSISLKLYDYIETKSIPDIGTRFQRLVQRLHFGWVTRKDWLKESFDLTLIFKPFDWPVALYWKVKSPQMKVIMSFQGEDFYPFDRFFYHSVDAAFAVSSFIAGIAGQRLGRQPSIIPNPVNITDFRPLETLMSEGAQEPFLIVATGRLIGWKGFDRLIHSLKRVNKNQIHFKVVIAGDGSEKDNLIKMTKDCGLENVIKFPGALPQDQLIKLLAKADLFIAPSVGLESFSIAALEAASMGIPLILSDQIGMTEFLKPNEYSGYESNNIDDLSELICTRITKNGKIPFSERLARHTIIAERFSSENIAHQIMKLIKIK